MTGYGRGECSEHGATFRVEIRSVNHRFQEVTVRMPRELLQLEDMIKREVQSAFSRGRLEVFVTMEPGQSAANEAEINWDYARWVVQSVKVLQERFGLDGSLSVSDLVHVPDLLTQHVTEEALQAWREPLRRAVQEACAALAEMRSAEGAALAKDILHTVKCIGEHIDAIRTLAPKVVEAYRERMTARVQEFLQELDVDEARLLTEAALFAEKSDIHEELIRLDSHCKQMQQLVSLDTPVGRKLDFLVQEMNREINTIGAKANDLAISRHVVDVKAELEKIREQVQNIE